jgi:hypothetical protein
MSYIEQNLQPDERVVFQTNLHSAILLPPAMVAVIALLLVPAAFAVSSRSLPASAVLAAVSLTLLGWAFRSGLSALTRYRNAELVVTNQRLVFNLGRSRRRATFENRSPHRSGRAVQGDLPLRCVSPRIEGRRRAAEAGDQGSPQDVGHRGGAGWSRDHTETERASQP